MAFLQVEVIKKAYMQGEVGFEDGENGEEGAASPRNVGHNIYILAHQVPPLPGPPPRATSLSRTCPSPGSPRGSFVLMTTRLPGTRAA